MRATSCPDGLVSVPNRFRASALGLRLAQFGLAFLLLCLLPACKPKELQALLEPSRALSTVLAEEAVRLAGAKKQVALITPDSSWGPPSVIVEYLKGALKKHGVTVVIAKAAEVGNPMFSGQIGLKSKDFFEALEKSAAAGAVISLAGAPLLMPGDAERASPDHPPVLVVATAMQGDKMGLRCDPLQLARLLEAKVIQLAIIDGADPVASPPGKSDAAHALFAQNYSILRRPN